MSIDEKRKRTLVVNLYGGPGSGKSTLMAKLFYKLKVRGVEVEMATEYAKDLVWEERQADFEDQIYIFGKQLHRINRVLGKVDVCICDSPIQNSYVYIKEENPELRSLIDSEFKKLRTFNLYVKRGVKYVQNGRNENEYEATVIDRKIEQVLETIPHTVVDRSVDIEYVVENIMKLII